MNTFLDLSNSRESRSDKNTTQLFCQELCLLYLPYSTSPVLTKLCQSVFAHGYTPVAVSSVGEALIHSRQAKFSVIILPDNDVELIKKIRDPGGQNSSTPVVVISPTDSFPESTLHLLENQVIQEVVVKSTDMEKFEGDLVSAMNHVVHSSNNTEDILSSFLPLQPRMNFLEAPHPVTSCSPPSQGAMAHICTVKQDPRIKDSGTFIDMKGQSEAPVNNVPQGPLFGFPTMYPFGPTSQGLLETMNTDQEKTTFRKGTIAHNTLPSFLAAPFFHPSAQASPTLLGPNFYREPGAVQGEVSMAESRGVGLLPGIETLLDAIQVREAQNAVQKPLGAEQEPPGYMNAENILRKPHANKDLPGKPPRFDICAIASEADVEPGDEKNPLSVAVQRPYFLTLDELKEKMADDPSVRAVDRHNAKERHRRVRISKASEFFKAAVPCMKETMDKATVFYLTTHYLLFLRNALNRRDPSILPKLRKTFKQEWSGVFNMELTGPE